MYTNSFHFTNLFKAFAIASLFFLVSASSADAATAQRQQCEKGQSCIIGEFLYTDEYVPIADATCTVTSKYPNGTAFLTNQAMSAAADGWYSHEFTAPTTLGLYRSVVSCTTTGGEFMSIDKTFDNKDVSTDLASSVWGANKSSYTTAGTFGEALQTNVPSTTAIATAVWGHSGRTLDNFGTLVADTWGYSSRQLTTFGTLAADVWASATRTLTGAGLTSGSLAVQSDVTSARDSVKGASNKDLSQVTTDVAGVKTDTASIKTTVEATQTTVGLIYTDTQAMRTDITSLLAKWGSLSASDLSTSINGVSTKLGTSEDSSAIASVFGRIKAVQEKWGSRTAQEIYDKADAASSVITLVRTELNYNGKSPTAYDDMQQLLTYVDSLEGSLGSAGDTSATASIFGRMKKIQEKVDTLSVINADLRGILDSWGTDNNIAALYTKVVDIRSKLDTIGTVSSTTNLSQTTINNIENISSVLNQTTITNTTLKELKNEVLTLSAVTSVNRSLLEKTVNKPIITTFLLEGSIIFKSIMTNPSETEVQTVPFISYLPIEVKKEDIIEYEEGLTIEYDKDKNQYYAKGEFSLEPGESKTVAVRVEDVWTVSDQKLESLKKQADQLYKPLVGTSYFGQAVTIKSDIDVALGKIADLQKLATTPEKKLRTHIEVKNELQGAQTKLDSMKDLVASAGSAGSLAGFVGGAQIMSMWGLIIVMIAGFVFLTIYMKVLRKKEHVATVSVDEVHESEEQQLASHRARPVAYAHVASGPHHWLNGGMAKYAAVIVVLSIVTASVSGATVYGLIARSEKTSNVLGESTRSLPELPFCKPGQLTREATGSSVLGEATKENMSQESTSAAALNTIQKKIITIGNTPTGFLRVREKPWGVEMTQVKPGQQFSYLSEENGWFQIRLLDKKLGWVSRQYASIDGARPSY